MQVSEEMVSIFINTFAGVMTKESNEKYYHDWECQISPRTPYGIQEIDPEGDQSKQTWRSVNHRRYTNSDVKSHLLGESYLAIPGYTNGIVIDLDAHTEDDSATLEPRTYKVLESFPDWSPLVLSTPRGRHIWFPRRPGILTDDERAKAYAEEQLFNSGYTKIFGKVEMYPDPNKLIRLPLGKDCHWLDHQSSLIPVASTNIRCLGRLVSVLTNEKVDWCEIPTAYRQPHDRIRAKGYKKNRVSNSEFNTRVDGWLDNGITDRRQTNKALLGLSWHYINVEGLSESETKSVLRKWIDEKNNGNSEEYDQCPEKAYDHIDRIVPLTKRNSGKDGHKARPSSKPVTLSPEIQSKTTDEEREFLYRLIWRTRAYGVRKRRWVYVEIPSQTLKSWARDVKTSGRNFNSWVGDYQYHLRKLKKLGILRDGQKYTTYGRCNTYKVDSSVLEDRKELNP